MHQTDKRAHAASGPSSAAPGPERPTQHKRFAANVVWQYGLQAAKYLFPFITLPYLTRVLGPHDYAFYSYVVSFMSFVQVVTDFGFNLSGTKLVARRRGDVEGLCRVTGAITQARLLLALAACPVVLLIARAIPLLADQELYVLLAYAAVVLKGLLPDFVFQGMEHMGPLTTRFVVSRGVSTAFTFLLVHSMADLLWVPVLDLVAGVIALALSARSMRRMFGIRLQRAPWRQSFSCLRESALYFVSLASSTAFNGFSTLLIGVVVSDPAQVSYWSIAMTAVTAVQALYSPVINSLYPHMVVNSDYSFVKRLFVVSLPVLLGGTALFAGLAPVIVKVIGGWHYMEGVWVMRGVAPVLVFSFYGMFFGWPVLGTSGKVAQLTGTTIVASAVNVSLLVLGAAMGWANLLYVVVMRNLAEALLCGGRVLLTVRFVRARHRARAAGLPLDEERC